MENSIFVRKSSVMNVKLTLSIDQHVVEKAKAYAADQNVSVSKLVERFLDSLEDSRDIPVSPIVAELSGIISGSVDERKERRDYLDKKHS